MACVNCKNNKLAFTHMVFLLLFFLRILGIAEISWVIILAPLYLGGIVQILNIGIKWLKIKKPEWFSN